MKHPVTAALGAGLALAALIGPSAATARESYLSEVFTVAGTFCPRGSLPADGRVLEIAQHQALFALIGTLYGGDGRTTFALPDLRGALAARTGSGTLAEVRHCIAVEGVFPSRP